MTDKHTHVNRNYNQQELRNFSLEKLGSDPAGAALYANRVWFNTADKRIKHYDGTSIKVLAHLEDIAKRLRLLGVNALAGGSVPLIAPTADVDNSTSIEAGDYFIASAAVTLAPAPAQGNATVEAGDMVIALTDNPASNADFAVVQVNLNLPVGLLISEQQKVAAADFTGFAAGTADDKVTLTFATLSGIANVQVRDLNTMHVVEVGVKYDYTANTVELCATYDMAADLLVVAVGPSV